MFFACNYLDGNVELTEERAGHITERHPELLPEHRSLIEETLAAPDQVRRSVRFGSAKLFSRWYADFRNGKHVAGIITAYIARKSAEGELEWQKS